MQNLLAKHGLSNIEKLVKTHTHSFGRTNPSSTKQTCKPKISEYLTRNRFFNKKKKDANFFDLFGVKQNSNDTREYLVIQEEV